MSTILQWVVYYSMMYNIDPMVTLAVIQSESSFRVNARGEAGEVGLMQLHPAYFKLPVKELEKVEVNIRLGVQYLAKVRDRCAHQQDNTWIICYNLGVSGGSKIKHPKLFPYYQRVMKEMQRSGGKHAEDFAVQHRLKVR